MKVMLKNSLYTFHSNLSEVCPEHRIAYLTDLHLSLIIASDAAADAAAASYAALQLSSKLAVKVALNNSTFLEQKYETALAAQKFASERVAHDIDLRMEIERIGFLRAAITANDASALMMANLQRKYDAAATAAADLSDSSQIAQRLPSKSATEEVELEANLTMTTERNASKLAAVQAREASSAKFVDQKSNFEAMAIAAADASDSSLIAERFVLRSE